MSEYDPKSIEPKWQAYWEKHKAFAAGKPGQKKFYCLDMFPYPSGAGLHVGHPLGYTATDIYSRYKRMCGFSVLHPMGFDAFGLPAEQHAVNTGEHPALITEANCKRYAEQLKLVGLSYDWDRNLATCTPDYYKWTQWIFLKLYNSYFDDKSSKARPIEELPIPKEVRAQGERAIQDYRAGYRLAYYADASVNWCPALGTVLANEEVIDGRSERGGHEVFRKPMKQWMLRITKYAERLLSELNEIDWPESIKEQQRNWIGKKTGTEIQFQIVETAQEIVAFTTRPDTLFGVTFFVVAPEHPLVSLLTSDEMQTKVREYCSEAAKMSEFTRTFENRKKTGVFTGKFVRNPINGEEIPVFVGDYVLLSYGTGAVMGVPSHDERDFEFARMFQLPIRPVIVPAEVPAETEQAIREGEMAWTGKGEMIPLDHKVFKELGLAGEANLEAASRITKWLVARNLAKQVVNYKLRDWLFSRQRYWGEPIPIIHWEDGEVAALSEDQLPLLLPKVEDYKPSESGESPLSRARDWLLVTDPKTGRKGRRETNTMPNWAGSCWYYLRFIDPKNSKFPWDSALEKEWMPVDLYVGGAEHAVLHLLYARFWHKVLYDLGYVSTKEPFQKLYNQGMVQAFAFKNKRGVLVAVDEVEQGEDGTNRHKASGEVLERIIAKMSKSLRNVETLDSIVSQYGADTYRMYLMFMGPLDSSRPWDPKAITGNFRFLKRVWTFVLGASGEGQPGREVVAEDAESVNVKRALHRLIKGVTEDIESLHFNTGVSSMMEFLNIVQHAAVSKITLQRFVLILAPFAPHIAEELWEKLGHKKTLSHEAWPSYEKEFLKDDSALVVIQIDGKKRSTIEVGVAITQTELKQAVIERMSTSEYQVTEKDQFITVYNSGTKVPKLVNVVRKKS